MGASKRDMAKKEREYSEKYPYEAKGVLAVLKDFNRLGNAAVLSGDYDAATILADITKGLNSSEVLTPKQRQCIALYYFANLKLRECEDVLGIDESGVKRHIRSGIRRIAEFVSNRALFSKGDPYVDYEETDELMQWVNRIGNGDEITVPGDVVILAIAQRFAADESKAEEMLRQFSEGHVEVFDPDDGKPEYPCLSESQMKWSDRRVTYVEEVFPPGDVLGSRKVATRDEEDKQGVEYRQDRRKMFRVRGI
jgi:predicted DNA-binding protein YlxM (UPF0122 family)